MNCYLCLGERIFDTEGRVIPLSKIPPRKLNLLPELEITALWFCDDCVNSTLKECVGDLVDAFFAHKDRLTQLRIIEKQDQWALEHGKSLQEMVELALTLR